MKARAWMTLAFVAAAAGAFAAEPAKPPSGQDLWQDNCVICHGPKGTPGAAQKKLGVADLASPKWQASRTDEAIRKIVTDGPDKPDTLMRGFRDELTDGEIESVVQYVRTLGKPAKKK